MPKNSQLPQRAALQSRFAKVKAPPVRVLVAKVKSPAQGGTRIAKVKRPSSVSQEDSGL